MVQLDLDARIVPEDIQDTRVRALTDVHQVLVEVHGRHVRRTT